MREIKELRLAQIGNFRFPHTTENELRDALLRLGVRPMSFQEDQSEDWRILIKLLRAGDFDMVLWTTTEPFADKIGIGPQYQMLDAAWRAGVPTIGYHLDRFIGLANREDTIDDRPFFSVTRLYTADGGHEAEWAAKGVAHQWMPPAISERWCQPGTSVRTYECDIAFVGSWQRYGHEDWPHRRELVRFLKATYGERFRCWPPPGHQRITGLELNDVYWSAKVVVGDSCLVPNPDGAPATHYCSDRIPETLGRGGFLVHPFVEGITGDQFVHYSWELGDWAGLQSTLAEMLAQTDMEEWRIDSIEAIKAAHTYTHRMRSVLAEWGWGE